MSHGRPQEGAEDEEEGAGALSREEGLDRAAALARAAPSSTLPALAEAISQRQQQLQQCASTGTAVFPYLLIFKERGVAPIIQGRC